MARGLKFRSLEVESSIGVVKTKALISFAVTAKLICVFVFAYTNIWLSHYAAQIVFKLFIFSLQGKRRKFMFMKFLKASSKAPNEMIRSASSRLRLYSLPLICVPKWDT